MIKATKILHKGETRIKVDFPYNQEFIILLRQIEGTKKMFCVSKPDKETNFWF